MKRFRGSLGKTIAPVVINLHLSGLAQNKAPHALFYTAQPVVCHAQSTCNIRTFFKHIPIFDMLVIKRPLLNNCYCNLYLLEL